MTVEELRPHGPTVVLSYLLWLSYNESLHAIGFLGSRAAISTCLPRCWLGWGRRAGGRWQRKINARE